MHDILGGELSIPEVERHTLAQIKRPFFLIRAGFPLLSQAGDVVAGLGIEVEQGLQEWVKLEMQWAGDGPEAVALIEPGGDKNQALDLGLPATAVRSSWRARPTSSQKSILNAGALWHHSSASSSCISANLQHDQALGLRLTVA